MNFKSGAHNLDDHRSLCSRDVAEAYLQQRYRNEIESVMEELKALLPAYREQLGGRTYDLAQANLSLLTSCYHSNVLSVPALEVLLEHLLTLSHMFTRLSSD